MSRSARSNVPSGNPMVEPEAAEGPTFPLPIKVLASVLVASLALYGVRIADRMLAAAWSASALFLVLAALGVTVVCYFRMLRSRTAIDAQFIRQDFLWPKKVALADITQAKIICVPYMSWLITPRLAVRARGGGMSLFYGGNEQVFRAFARLSLKAWPGVLV